jgi:hypothetical protein
MKREPVRSPASSVEVAYKTLLESFGKLDRAGQVAIVRSLKTSSLSQSRRPAPMPGGPAWRAGEDHPRGAARARSGSGIWLSAEESFVGKSSLLADGEAVVRSGQGSEVRQLLGVVDVTGETNLAAHRRSNFLRSSRGISLITKTPGLCPELVGLNARGPLKVHRASWCWRALRRPGIGRIPPAATGRTRTTGLRRLGKGVPGLSAPATRAPGFGPASPSGSDL